MKKLKIQFSFSRNKEIERLRKKLEQDSFPRIQMFLLVSMTSGVAFLTSFILLHLGFNSMPIRYLIVCLVAYSFFLIFLWLWLRTRLEEYSDIGTISDLPQMNIDTLSPDFHGGGGEFGGGGASGTFDESPPITVGLINAEDNPVVEALGAAGEAEEFALPLIVLILIVTIILSSAFVIYSAPILFSELLVDSLLAAGLYKKLRKEETQHWLSTAIRRTIVPFLITTVVSVAAGYAFQYFAPQAKSLGDILQIISK